VRALILGCVLAVAAVPAVAKESHRVSGYTKKDGTYVAPTRRTNPDGRLSNNYGSKPNVNPSSGRAGTVDPYKPKAAPKPRF
jgi:hypothetical protein